MKKSVENLSAIIKQSKEQLDHGTQCLDYGLKDPLNLSETEKEMIKQQTNTVPILFRKDATESLIYQMFLVEHYQKIPNTNELKELEKKLSDLLRPASVQEVQVMIETIASTFSCDVPNKLGLQTYWELLKNYSGLLMPHVTLNILKTYDYPRLPVPKVFIEYLNRIQKEHYKFYYRVKNCNEYTLQIEQK